MVKTNISVAVAIMASFMAIVLTTRPSNAPTPVSPNNALTPVSPRVVTAAEPATVEPLPRDKPRPMRSWCPDVDGDKQSGVVTVKVSTIGCRVPFQPKAHMMCESPPDDGRKHNPPVCTTVHPWETPPTCTVEHVADLYAGVQPFDASGVETSRDMLLVPGARTGHQFRYTCKAK